MRVKKLVYLVVNNFYLVGLLIPTLIPFFMLSLYNHPVADDYCYASTTKELGILQSQISWYTGWSGRFFSTFLLSINPMYFDSINLYKIMAAVLLLLYMFALYSVISIVFKNILTKVQKITGALFIVWIYIYQLPTLIEGIYWLTGAYTYFVSVILSLFVILFGLKAVDSPEHRKRNYIISCFLLFLLIGTNETIMVVWDILLVLVLIYISIRDRRINKYVLGLLSVAVVSSFIVYFAPGNEIRIMVGGQTKSEFLWAIIQSIEALYISIRDWVTPATFIVISLFVYPIYRLVKERSALVSKLYVHPIYIVFMGFVAIVGAFFTSFWSVGGYPPERAINRSYFVFLAFCIIFVFNTVYFLAKRNIEIRPIPIYIHILIYLILVMLTPQGRNIMTPIRSISSGMAYQYDQFQLDRYATIDICKQNNTEVCVVEEREYQVDGLITYDISNDPTDWKNVCVARFYNIKSIQTR